MTLKPPEPTGATPLTPDEMLGLKVRHITDRGELESENIIEGLTWLDRRPKSFNVLTDGVVREIHKHLLGKAWDWTGMYRLTGKNIDEPVWHISAEMRTCLDDARYWRENGTYVPLEAATRFHHRLVWIHPFANGNERWGGGCCRFTVHNGLYATQASAVIATDRQRAFRKPAPPGPYAMVPRKMSPMYW